MDEQPSWSSPTRFLGLLMPWAACWLAVGWFALADPAPTSLGSVGAWQWIPLAASLVLLGLPHGAVDHLEVARLVERRLSSPTVLGLLAGYLALAAVVVALWWVAPTASFSFFIALTWFHWGQGDLWFLDHVGQLEPGSSAGRRLSGALHGALPMLGPLAWDPSSYRTVYRATTALFGTPTVAASTWATASQLATWTLGGLLASFAVLHLLDGSLDRRRLQIVDLATLVLFFASVPGIFAVGLYFCLWHGARHVIRLADRRADGARPNWRNVGHTLWQATPLTAVSIAGMLAIGIALVPDAPDGPLAPWLGWYLVAISGLTAPHTAVVLGMDSYDRPRLPENK